MISAIVYKSKTGFTQEYAKLLSKKINVMAYSMEEANKKCKKGEKIIYMGWIMAGNIKGYKKADKKYSIEALCAVGMGEPSKKVTDELANKYNIPNEKLFYLQGGFDLSKLKGVSKLMMKMMKKKVCESIQNKENKTKEDERTLEMFTNGGNYVREDKLEPIISYINFNL